MLVKTILLCSLLVLDLKKQKWSHYNTFHPKGKKKFDNHYLNEAKMMVTLKYSLKLVLTRMVVKLHFISFVWKDAVTHAMNIWLYMRDQPHMEESMKIVVEECPQQGET